MPLEMKSVGCSLLGDDGGPDVGPMSASEVYDRLAAMRRQEEQYLCRDYLAADSHANANGDSRLNFPLHHHQTEDSNGKAKEENIYHNNGGRQIDVSCRSRICEWLFTVVDYTKFRRETVATAMSYLDRFLCTSSIRAERARSNRQEYQAAALTSLYIAVKLFEPLEMDAAFVSRLSRGFHSAEQIAEMEFDILAALGWKMNGPTALQFANHILELLPRRRRLDKSLTAALDDFSRFQTELAVCEYAFVPIRRSTIAVASILNSLEGVPIEDLPFEERVDFLQAMADATGIDIFSAKVNAVRSNLLDAFARTDGYEVFREAAGFTPVAMVQHGHDNWQCNSSTFSPSKNAIDVVHKLNSPVCVSREQQRSSIHV